MSPSTGNNPPKDEKNEGAELFWALYIERADAHSEKELSRASTDLEGILTFVSHVQAFVDPHLT